MSSHPGDAAPLAYRGPIFPNEGGQRNKLLGALPPADWRRLEQHLSIVELRAGQTLSEPSTRLEYAYFPTTAIISLLHLARDGTSTKVATIGHEGLVGIALVMGGGAMNHQAVVHSTGRLYRVRREVLIEEFSRGGATHDLLLLYVHALLVHISQIAVCNRRHTIEQQLCRWLLLSLDRLNSEHLDMTHELLANTLGVRREGITEAAQKLQCAGLINYRRGHIRVIQRAGLEARCCECYGIIRREYVQLERSAHARSSQPAPPVPAMRH